MNDLVTAIRRPRNAVRKEQDFLHQPRPLAIHGPSRLAMPSGSRCHTAICALYLGLLGLTSRGSAPSAVRTA